MSENYIWLSFCDQEKPTGEQFLGVIITKALTLVEAVTKTHEMGINPGGEVLGYDIESIKENSTDILLSRKDLVEFGYID